ncbi:dehydrase and lipid transport-domain-containing protein [Mycena sanguinolenta]|nr:dehydrase and lipid transport-domain-containing protein [Mycena sanguinolenta]
MLRVLRPGVHRRPVSTRRRHLFSLPDLSSILPGGPELQTYREQKTLPYTRQQLYQVVSDVGSYHHFIPFCSASRVLSTTDETQIPMVMDAELTVEFLAFKESYVSRVTCIPLESVKAVASSATPLFKDLTTMWRFQSISGNETALSSMATPTTLVKLDLAFAFASPIHAAISSSFFGQVSKLMVNAFEERCAEVYGPK